MYCISMSKQWYGCQCLGYCYVCIDVDACYCTCMQDEHNKNKQKTEKIPLSLKSLQVYMQCQKRKKKKRLICITKSVLHLLAKSISNLNRIGCKLDGRCSVSTDAAESLKQVKVTGSTCQELAKLSNSE